MTTFAVAERRSPQVRTLTISTAFLTLLILGLRLLFPVQASSCNDTAHTVSVAAGQFISIKTSDSNSISTVVTCAFEVELS